MSSFGLRTNLTVFVSTPYHSRLYSSNGYGGYLACRRAEGSREGCLHQGSRKSGVLAEAELGRGGKVSIFYGLSLRGNCSRGLGYFTF